MSRFSQLQELLNKEGNLKKLSFYPDFLLDLRSILSDWVEEQDWTGVLCLSGTELTNRSKELWEKVISLLQAKPKNPGFEFYVHNTETKLKSAYQNEPVKFVEDLHSCLTQEEELLNSMMAQAQDRTMFQENGPVLQQMSASDLSARINNCRQLDNRVYQVLRAAFLCIENWPDDIRNKGTTPRDVFKNGEVLSAPYTVLQGLKKELEQKSRLVNQELQGVLSAMQWYLVQWKTWQLHCCVCRKVEGESEDFALQVEDMCEQICASVGNLMTCVTSRQFQTVNTAFEQTLPHPPSSSSSSFPTPSSFSWFSLALKDILRKILEMFLVVKKQPPLTMMIEKEKGQKDKEDINNSKKFTTTVGLLGGKGFGEGVLMTEVEIYLAFGQDLHQAQIDNGRPANVFHIFHDKPDPRRGFSSRHRAGGPDSPCLPYERTYEKLRVEHFSRRETKHVYKQLYHVVYDVKVHFPAFMQEFKTQAISFPIIVRTGANQASEHIGAQLWHSYSSPNVYKLQGEMASSMKVSQVLQMFNQRIRFIGGEGLRQHEMEFLKERLHMVAGGKGDAKYAGDTTITLDNFIKDKVYLPRHGSAMPTKDLMDFSLWRWLHSIINLLDDPENLKNPWIEGVIFGFASRAQCIRALEGSVDGTFLLRFSESALQGNHKMAKGGLAAVIHRHGQVDFAPPISSDDIEKDGLGNMISSTGCQFLYGTSLTIADLCARYPASKPLENPTSNRYTGWRKQECLVPNDQMLNSSPNPYLTTTTTTTNTTTNTTTTTLTSQPQQATRRPPKKPKRPSQRSHHSSSSSTTAMATTTSTNPTLPPSSSSSSSPTNSKQYRVAPPGSPESISNITSSSVLSVASSSCSSPPHHHPLLHQPHPHPTSLPTTLLFEEDDNNMGGSSSNNGGGGPPHNHHQNVVGAPQQHQFQAVGIQELLLQPLMVQSPSPSPSSAAASAGSVSVADVIWTELQATSTTATANATSNNNIPVTVYMNGQGVGDGVGVGLGFNPTLGLLPASFTAANTTTNASAAAVAATLINSSSAPSSATTTMILGHPDTQILTDGMEYMGLSDNGGGVGGGGSGGSGSGGGESSSTMTPTHNAIPSSASFEHLQSSLLGSNDPIFQSLALEDAEEYVKMDTYTQ